MIVPDPLTGSQCLPSVIDSWLVLGPGVALNDSLELLWVRRRRSLAAAGSVIDSINSLSHLHAALVFVVVNIGYY